MEINLAIIDFNPGQGGGVKPSGTLDISENGVYNVYTYASASVDVHPSISLSETYISNGSYNITGEFNGGVITVDVPAPQFVTETLNVSANGTYNPGEGVDGYSQVVVDVPQSVTGYTQKEITEGVQIVNLSNSASFIRSYAFNNYEMLKTVYLPNCTRVNDNAFNGCLNLETVYLPNCSYIGKYCFYNCKFSFISVSLNALIIDDFAFADCLNLHFVDLTNCNQINRYAFRYCSNLESIYINYSSVASLAVNVFQATNSSFKVYVPSSLVSDYQAATNWSDYSNRIFPIE